MDHVIDYIRNYKVWDKEEFIKEFKSGNYKKISDCPSYEKVKAYCDCINILAKAHYHEDYARNHLTSPSKIISLLED